MASNADTDPEPSIPEGFATSIFLALTKQPPDINISVDDCQGMLDEFPLSEAIDVFLNNRNCFKSCMTEPFRLYKFDKPVYESSHSPVSLILIKVFTVIYSHDILRNFERLERWVSCYESALQRRWMKKNPQKRRELLLEVWPYIARSMSQIMLHLIRDFAH